MYFILTFKTCKTENASDTNACIGIHSNIRRFFYNMFAGFLPRIKPNYCFVFHSEPIKENNFMTFLQKGSATHGIMTIYLDVILVWMENMLKCANNHTNKSRIHYNT